MTKLQQYQQNIICVCVDTSGWVDRCSVTRYLDSNDNALGWPKSLLSFSYYIYGNMKKLFGQPVINNGKGGSNLATETPWVVDRGVLCCCSLVCVLFWLQREAWGILASLPGMEPASSAVEAQTLWPLDCQRGPQAEVFKTRLYSDLFSELTEPSNFCLLGLCTEVCCEELFLLLPVPIFSCFGTRSVLHHIPSIHSLEYRSLFVQKTDHHMGCKC